MPRSTQSTIASVSARFGYEVSIALPRWIPGHKEDAQALVQGFRDFTLRERDPEHPLLWGMFCLQWAAKFRHYAETRPPDVMIWKPNSKKAAFVRADAPDKEWDKMRRHFHA